LHLRHRSVGWGTGAHSLAASACFRTRLVGRRLVDRVNRDEMSILVSTEPQILEMIEVRKDGRVRVRLRGELDLSTVDAVAQRLNALGAQHDAVLLDLDELDFIDASGIRLVLSAANDARNDGWAFGVTRGSRPVRRLFALLGIDEQLPYAEEPS
jgi:anti-anti-sigma factor